MRKRANWQTVSGAKALETEELVRIALQSALDGVYPGKFEVGKRQPEIFKTIYSTYPLPEVAYGKIYNVDTETKKTLKYKWGNDLDFTIRNRDNGKILFGEIKRQDG